MTNKENAKTAQSPQMPVLYEKITPLLTDLHKDLKLVQNQKYKFAAKTNSIPIAMHELTLAAKDFPIIFAGDDSGTMLAVLGIKQGENLFVDENNDWLPNTYIPVYIRRYPFFVAKRDENSEPIICIEETSNLLTEDEGEPLFVDGKPTKTMNNIADFSSNFHKQLELTIDFGRALEEMKLLEEQQVSFKVGEEVKASVNGFKTLIRPKFNELEGDVLKEWLSKGWLDAAILHLSSGSNFDRLWKLERARNP